MDITWWLIGLGVSVIIGGVVTWLFIIGLERYLRVQKEAETEGDLRSIPSWLTGAIERLFFTVAVALNLSGTATAMIGWLTLKMVTNWNRPGGERDAKHIRGAFIALLAGLVSMLFAAIGGYICRADWLY